MRRRRPKPAQLDEEFQEEIIDHHRAGDGEEVAEKLRPRGKRRTAESHVAVQPKPGEKGQRKNNQHRRDMRGNRDEPEVEQLLVEHEIIEQEIAPPAENHVRAAANGITERLARQ